PHHAPHTVFAVTCVCVSSAYRAPPSFPTRRSSDLDDPEHHAPAHYGARTPTHKYIHYYNDGLGTPGSSDRVMPAEEELYDLVADPRELTNVAHDVAYTQIRQQLRALTA